jgi:hypothetical protein
MVNDHKGPAGAALLVVQRPAFQSLIQCRLTALEVAQQVRSRQWLRG